MDCAFLRADPAQLLIAGDRTPETSHVGDNGFERAPNHNRGESVDRGDADLRAAAEREGKPMAFEVIAGVGP